MAFCSHSLSTRNGNSSDTKRNAMRVSTPRLQAAQTSEFLSETAVFADMQFPALDKGTIRDLEPLLPIVN